MTKTWFSSEGLAAGGGGEKGNSGNRQPRKTAGRQAATSALSTSDTGREMPWKASSMDGACRAAKGGAVLRSTGACYPASFLDHRRPVGSAGRRGTARGFRCGSSHVISGRLRHRRH